MIKIRLIGDNLTISFSPFQSSSNRSSSFSITYSSIFLTQILIFLREVKGDYNVKDEIEYAHDILKLVGLNEKSDRKVHMLSGGEKRRVAIARALMQKPNVLLADEIISELDSVTAREVMNVIKDAQKKLNLTSIMIHHDMNLALEYANRVAVIKDGEKVLEIGVEGEQIIDFQTGNLTQQEILEMYNEPQK